MSQEPVNGLIPTPPRKEAWEDWGDGYSGKKVSSRLEVWNSSTLQWERMTQPGAAGGGGGGPATIADGADVAEGATTDAAVVTDANGTVSGKLRGLVKWAFERMPASLGQKTMAASLPVVLPSDQSAVPVSGTFFPGTQPVSLAAAVALDAASLAALETISVANFPATQPVSGTFWQATQPVSAASLPLPAGAATSAAQTDGSQIDQARGKLWTGAAWVDAPGDATNGAKVQSAQLPAALVGGRLDQNNGAWFGSTAPTVGQKAMASSLPVVVASDQSVIPVNNSQWLGSAAPTVGQKTMASSVPVTIASDQPALAAPTLTKGTQGATGYSVQALKDAGRVGIQWTAEVAGAATTEGLLTVTESRDGAATTTFTTKVVTNGKRLRIHSLQIAVETLGSGTAPQRCYLRLRFNTAGAVVVGSALQGTWLGANNAAVVKTATTISDDFPEGIEYLGDGTKQVGFTIQFPDWIVTTATVKAYITISAFEY